MIPSPMKHVFIQVCVAFVDVPLSVISTMAVSSTTSVVFNNVLARDPVIVMDAPQSAHTFDLSSSGERV